MSRVDLGPRNVSHNFYRIVNGVCEINRRYGFHLSEWDLLFCYTVQKVKRDENRWYLKSRPEKALVHMLPDTIKSEDDMCVVTGHWMHEPGSDPLPAVPLISLGLGNEVKKFWLKGIRADIHHIKEVLKFLGGPELYPFARVVPILFNFKPTYKTFIAPPQTFTLNDAISRLRWWFRATAEQKQDFYALKHRGWVPPPPLGIPLAVPIGTVEVVNVPDSAEQPRPRRRLILPEEEEEEEGQGEEEED